MIYVIRTSTEWFITTTTCRLFKYYVCWFSPGSMLVGQVRWWPMKWSTLPMLPALWNFSRSRCRVMTLISGTTLLPLTVCHLSGLAMTKEQASHPTTRGDQYVFYVYIRSQPPSTQSTKFLTQDSFKDPTRVVSVASRQTWLQLPNLTLEYFVCYTRKTSFVFPHKLYSCYQ